MDSFFRFARRLIFGVLVGVAAVCMAPALAQSCATYASAMASCQAALSAIGANSVNFNCSAAYASGSTTTGSAFLKRNSDGVVFGSWNFCGSIPPPCNGAPNIQGTIYAADNGGTPSGIHGGCLFYPCGVDSASNGSGQSAYTGTWCATGASAPVGTSDSPGFGKDSTGNQQSVPKLCGDTSCADPNSGKICSQVNGSSVCVPAPAGWTGGASTTPYQPTCNSGSGGTVCAGSPPPLPPAPPASPISDPATQIKGSDQYQVGAISGTSPSSLTTTNGMLTVNTYGTPGSTADSGKTSGDNGPAPASSTSKDGGSASGGGDCNSPPVCSGDAVNCAMVREEWQTMCQVKASGDQLHKDLAGDGTQQPPTGGEHTGSELTGSTVDTGDTSKLDASGFGWDSSCPLSDYTLTIAGVSVSMQSFKPVCDNAGLYRSFVMLLAGLGCAAILGGFKVGSIFGGGS